MATSPDRVDREILKILLRNAEITKSDIAKNLKIAPSAISERIKKLEECGLIRRYETRLDAGMLGFDLLAFIFIGEKKPSTKADLGERLAKVRGVEEVHKIAGEDCFIVKIRARGTSELADIIDNEINTLDDVTSVRTTIVLRTLLEDVSLGGNDLTVAASIAPIPHF